MSLSRSREVVVKSSNEGLTAAELTKFRCAKISVSSNHNNNGGGGGGGVSSNHIACGRVQVCVHGC